MFTLLYGLFEYIFRRDEYHILILGLDKAGKTNVLERLKSMYTQAIGLDPGKILPTGKQARRSSLRSPHAHVAHACRWERDVGNPNTFN
jgi:hypothetical protein